MALSFGNSIAPIVCGFLIQSKGWRWYEWVVSILAGANWLLIFFLAPETDYKRDLHKSIDSTGANSGDEETPTSAGQSDAEIESKPGVIRLETKDSNAPNALPKQPTYLGELIPWSGTRDGSLLAAYMRPWAMWAYPTFAWGVLSFSLHVTV